MIGLSMRLGWGGFSWWSVLSLVPGIWEDPLLGTFWLAGGRGGAAHHGPGVRPYTWDLPIKEMSHNHWATREFPDLYYL